MTRKLVPCASDGVPPMSWMMSVNTPVPADPLDLPQVGDRTPAVIADCRHRSRRASRRVSSWFTDGVSSLMVSSADRRVVEARRRQDDRLIGELQPLDAAQRVDAVGDGNAGADDAIVGDDRWCRRPRC